MNTSIFITQSDYDLVRLAKGVAPTYGKDGTKGAASRHTMMSPNRLIAQDDHSERVISSGQNQNVQQKLLLRTQGRHFR